MELERGVRTPYTTPIVHDPTNLIEELAMEEVLGLKQATAVRGGKNDLPGV
jgi:hypothetical protein